MNAIYWMRKWIFITPLRKRDKVTQKVAQTNRLYDTLHLVSGCNDII